ncbi:MAG: glycosyltransferase family 9 protein [Pseudobdellovibrio sp.]
MSTEPREINLVVQTAFLGDVILSIPVLKRIKKIFPKQDLVIVCKRGLGQFLLNERIVDRVIEVRKSDKGSYAEALNVIKQYKVNHIFCLHRSIRSLLFVSKIKANKKIGFSSLLGFWFLDEQVEYVKENPEVIRQFKILINEDEEVAEQFSNSDYKKFNQLVEEIPEFFAFEKIEITKTTSKHIAVFPGSVWATKRWTKEGFIALVHRLIESGYKVDLFGSPDEQELCYEIAGHFDGVVVLAGKLSIADTLTHLSEYDCVISNDSASTHMAAYKNIPVISIFGPTTLDLGFRPWTNQAAVVENKLMKCRPCGAHGHQKCPLGHHNCMNSITPEHVMQALSQLLS